MEKDLTYFRISNSYGGNQKWFYDPVIRFYGCGAIVTCDICIYLNLFKDIKNLYPFNIDCLNKDDFIKFSKIMKNYLHPKMNGISTLQLYIDGFKSYLESIKCNEINIKPFSGANSVDVAQNIVMSQIDKEIPIPFLLLKHKNKKLYDYVWHWFIISGYKKTYDDLLVKVITYGNYEWISFNELWDNGYEQKGGMIIVDIK